MDYAAERELLMQVAWHYLGTPYIWAGDDPSGFDCSGFAIECLQSVGILPRKGDWSAAALFEMFKAHPAGPYPQPGDLAFYRGDSGAIIHVEIMVDSKRSIGASGGGSANVTVDAAWRRNAYIKVRPVASRTGLAGILDPFQAPAGVVRV